MRPGDGFLSFDVVMGTLNMLSGEIKGLERSPAGQARIDPALGSQE